MNKKKYLTSAERIKIEALLEQGFSIRSIADFLEKYPSTIAREIQKHSLVKKNCEHYNKRSCEHWNGSTIKLCNGCTKRGYCRLEKYL